MSLSPSNHLASEEETKQIRKKDGGGGGGADQNILSFFQPGQRSPTQKTQKKQDLNGPPLGRAPRRTFRKGGVAGVNIKKKKKEGGGGGENNK